MKQIFKEKTKQSNVNTEQTRVTGLTYWHATVAASQNCHQSIPAWRQHLAPKAKKPLNRGTGRQARVVPQKN